MVSWVVAAALLCAVDALTDGSLSDPGLRNIPVIGDVSSTSGESTSGAQYLDGISWTASSATAGLSIPARVPGDLISDLQLAGKIGDPYFENNFLDASTWNQPDWVYSRKFIPNSDLISAGNKATLVLESVKMGAMVMLNGVHLGNVTDQFVRYSFDVTGRLKPDSAAVLELKFDSEIETHGRFMPCTGGWDWAPWSHTWDQTGAPTFSKGIVGSVYLLPVMQMLLTAVTAHTFYLGQHATVPLEDGHHSGFRVLVTAHLSVVAPEGVTTTLKVRGSWSDNNNNSNNNNPAMVQTVRLSHGDHAISFNLTATASEIKLWWPNGVGAQPLYQVSITAEAAGESGAGLLRSTRSVGFRSLAWVTGNDSDPEFVANASSGDGSASPTFTTFLRVNGARIFARGSNMVPLDELEARVTAGAYRKTVSSAAAAGMNMLRVWAGGIYFPDAFYDACDAQGVLVYHDMMFAQEGHAPCCGWYGPCWYGKCDLAREQTESCTCDSPAGRTLEIELRQQVRRLSSHASIVVWDAVNEAGGFGLYASFVMRIVAEEDASRVVWPASPSQGWSSGVHTLSGLPNGRPLQNQGWCPDDPSSAGGRCGCQDTKEIHGPYDFSANGFSYDFGNYTPAMPAAMPHGGSGPGPHPATPIDLFTPLFPTVFLQPRQREWPSLPDVGLEVGMSSKGYFVSEFGVPAMSSFESLAPSLSAANLGVHTPPFHRRSHNSDGFILSYFGPGAASPLEEVGEAALRGQVYLSMLSQALHLVARIEGYRSSNVHGLLTWDLGEIWPTAGWGSLEYGSGSGIPGAVEGGRWKPAHHALVSAFSDVIVACGVLDDQSSNNNNKHFTCYLRNDSPWASGPVRVSTSFLHLSTGAATVLDDFLVDSVPAVAELGMQFPDGQINALKWFCIDNVEASPRQRCSQLEDLLRSAGCESHGADCLLNVTTSRLDGSRMVESIRPMISPANLTLPSAKVSLLVLARGAGATVVALHPQVAVSAEGGVALWVVLTTLAEGRFSDNGFFVRPGHPRVVDFLPLDAGVRTVTTADELLLQNSLKVEHLFGALQQKSQSQLFV